MSDSMLKAIREFLPVPAYVAVCANMVRYDLLHGPAFARLPAEGIKAITDDDLALLYSDAFESCDEGDSVVCVYESVVADTLRDWLAFLPTLYYEEWSGDVTDSEPQGEEIEGEWYEPEYREVSDSDVVEALFGRTIAREFR
jgi:hypothetical protein